MGLDGVAGRRLGRPTGAVADARWVARGDRANRPLRQVRLRAMRGSIYGRIGDHDAVAA